MRVVVMGVTSTGKTRIGGMLARALGGRFVDGDDLHPSANRRKMAAGVPLEDADRWPWLDRVGAELSRPPCPVVMACSALKKSYRARIAAAAGGPVRFLHLDGPRHVIAERMAAREGHFMPVSLLDSQIATLEAPGAEEGALRLDLVDGPERIVAAAEAWLRGA